MDVPREPAVDAILAPSGPLTAESGFKQDSRWFLYMGGLKGSGSGASPTHWASPSQKLASHATVGPAACSLLLL